MRIDPTQNIEIINRAGRQIGGAISDAVRIATDMAREALLLRKARETAQELTECRACQADMEIYLIIHPNAEKSEVDRAYRQVICEDCWMEEKFLEHEEYAWGQAEMETAKHWHTWRQSR